MSPTAHWSSINRIVPVNLTPKAFNFAYKYGLGDTEEDVLTEVGKLLWLSVPIKHPNANRRYKEWLFTLKGDTVTFLRLITCTDCLDTRRVLVYDVCSLCDGEGCEKCEEGLTPTVIRCLSCTH